MSFRERWQPIIEQNRELLINASSWVGATIINSVLGFLYWWLAARLFSPRVVGLASAAISAMLLLGNVGMLGLGTLLQGELPRQHGRELGLVLAALITAGLVGSALGMLFAIATPVIAPDLAPFSASPQAVTLLALGTGLTATSLVLDQALIGLLRGELQLQRNILFALAKLVFLVLGTSWWIGEQGLGVYATWVAGNVVSLLAIAAKSFPRQRYPGQTPQWYVLRRLGRPAIMHHVLNLALMAPGLVAPLIVTALLSARLNASFYIAWMMASLVFVVPGSLAMVLYTVSATDQRRLGQQLRLALGVSLATGLLANVVLMVGADTLLRLFGADYAQEAQWSLRVLGLGVFPLMIKLSYVTVRRVENQVALAALAMAGGGVLEIALLTLGTHWGGLTGLSLGWLSALSLEALLAAPLVVKATRDTAHPAELHDEPTGVPDAAPGSSVHHLDEHGQCDQM